MIYLSVYVSAYSQKGYIMPEQLTEKATIAHPRYAPIHPQDNGMRETPESKVAHASAFRVVLLQSLSSAFDLTPDESIMVGVKLDSLLAPLLQLKPHAVPFSVRQEMLDGAYSRQLALRSKSNIVRGQVQFNPKVLSATLEDWVDALMMPLLTSYDLRAFDEAEMRGHLQKLLRQIGVGDPVSPRGAIYMPSDLRARLFADRSRKD
jgi:hypothetical protein